MLQLNDENINNFSNDTLASVSFSALANSSHESSISIVDTKTITTEQYIDGTAGLELVLSIGGSGVSGGYEYSTSKRYGQTTSTSQDSAKVLRYTLADDDSGDIFYTTIVRDPMFGTPIFRRDGATASSCPFGGGYQRDQPLLKHSDISGSTVIGTRCTIGGAVAIAGHIRIADDVVIGGGTSVPGSIPAPGVYAGGGTPADTLQRWRRNMVRFGQLDELARRLRAVEKRIKQDPE